MFEAFKEVKNLWSLRVQRSWQIPTFRKTCGKQQKQISNVSKTNFQKFKKILSFYKKKQVKIRIQNESNHKYEKPQQNERQGARNGPVWDEKFMA